jgi:hypothetical protein
MESQILYTKAILMPFQRVQIPRAPLQNTGDCAVIVERVGNNILFRRA